MNEYSARYSILDNEFYLPRPEQLAAQSKSNRQGRAEVISGKEAERVFSLLKKDAELVYEHYMEMLNEGEAGAPLDPERSGLAREHGVTCVNAPGTIDADYTGPVIVLLINHGDRPVRIEPGQRIAQLVIAPVVQAELVEADALPATERGSGGFGSTGR